MGTRSNIGIVKDDGAIEIIYCHWDGYPEWVGLQLVMNYKDIRDVQTLLSLGDRASLHGAPTALDSYNDRGEDTKSITFASFAEYDASPKRGAEFVYLYQNGTWFIYEVADDDTLVYAGVIEEVNVKLGNSQTLELPTGV